MATTARSVGIPHNVLFYDRLTTAMNPKTPEYALLNSMKDPSVAVRMAAVLNPSATKTVHLRGMEDHSSEVRIAADVSGKQSQVFNVMNESNGLLQASLVSIEKDCEPWETPFTKIRLMAEFRDLLRR